MWVVTPPKNEYVVVLKARLLSQEGELTAHAGEGRNRRYFPRLHGGLPSQVVVSAFAPKVGCGLRRVLEVASLRAFFKGWFLASYPLPGRGVKNLRTLLQLAKFRRAPVRAGQPLSKCSAEGPCGSCDFKLARQPPARSSIAHAGAPKRLPARANPLPRWSSTLPGCEHRQPFARTHSAFVPTCLTAAHPLSFPVSSQFYAGSGGAFVSGFPSLFFPSSS